MGWRAEVPQVRRGKLDVSAVETAADGLRAQFHRPHEHQRYQRMRAALEQHQESVAAGVDEQQHDGDAAVFDWLAF